jgi:hypothetical protein
LLALVKDDFSESQKIREAMPKVQDLDAKLGLKKLLLFLPCDGVEQVQYLDGWSRCL